MEKKNQNITELFRPEEYADLVAQTEAMFRKNRNVDDIIQMLADKIARTLEEEKRAQRRIVQAEGIAAAKARGVHLGRPRIEPPANFPMVLKQYLDGNLSVNVAASLCGVATSTFYRMKKEALAEETQKRAESV